MKKILNKVKDMVTKEPKVERNLNQEYTDMCVKLGDALYKKFKMEIGINGLLKQIEELDKLAIEQQKNKKEEVKENGQS